LHSGDVAERPVVDQALRQTDPRQIAEAEIDAQGDAVALAAADDVARLLHRDRQRLLEQHVLAASGRLQCEVPVQVVGHR
jgi:hypothetical protein